MDIKLINYLIIFLFGSSVMLLVLFLKCLTSLHGIKSGLIALKHTKKSKLPDLIDELLKTYQVPQFDELLKDIDTKGVER